jgi:hypothetical protein
MKMCMWKRASSNKTFTPNCSSIYFANHSSSNQEQGGRKVGTDSYKKIKIHLIPKSIFC